MPEIVKLVKEFHEESLDAYNIFCNEDVLNKIMPPMVETSMVMVNENKIVGVIAGFITTHIQDDTPLWQEVVWFVSKEYRRYGVRLLEKMEWQCKTNGIKHMVMVQMGWEYKFHRLYENMGYTLLESHYSKKI